MNAPDFVLLRPHKHTQMHTHLQTYSQLVSKSLSLNLLQCFLHSPNSTRKISSLLFLCYPQTPFPPPLPLSSPLHRCLFPVCLCLRHFLLQIFILASPVWLLNLWVPTSAPVTRLYTSKISLKRFTSYQFTSVLSYFTLSGMTWTKTCICTIF